MSFCVGDTIFAISFTYRETPSQLLDQYRCHRTGKNDTTKIRQCLRKKETKKTIEITELTLSFRSFFSEIIYTQVCYIFFDEKNGQIKTCAPNSALQTMLCTASTNSQVKT